MRLAPILLAACALALPQAPALGQTPVVPASSPIFPGSACSHDLAPEPLDGTDQVYERLAASKDPCAVADNNIAREEAEILTGQPAAATSARSAWDHKAKPQYLDLVSRRFDLQPAELAMLTRNGFVVPARLEAASFAVAYHEIFQSQLPVYVSADSIFQAIFASHDSMLESLENARLAPMLSQAFGDMHCALPDAAKAYPPETVRDLDLYLLVGRRLIADPYNVVGQPHSVFKDEAVEKEADALIASVTAGNELQTVTLFGRPRAVDFTQYGPRGHYTDDERMQRYFRAATWASRLEFNLVSRSSRSSAPGASPDPSETPREAIDAIALADLAGRSGAAKAIADLDAAWAVLAGRREDVSIAELAELGAGVGPLNDAGAFDKLKAAIGDRFKRTTRIHPMPEGSTELPAIATLIGPRIVADAGALTMLAHSAVPDRNRLGVADVAYTFGLERAKTYLAKDLAAYPSLAGQLEAARTQLARAPSGGDDLYSAWLAAIRALARAPEGATPSFLSSEAGADLRLNTIAAAYGQIKHNYALVEGQPYAEVGCEIPDGYVEPAPAAYDALIEYAARGAKFAALLDPFDASRARAHFERVGKVLRVLRTIVGDELAGRPLGAAERRWLGMVAELNLNRKIILTGSPPTYTGWYFDLYFDRSTDGMRGADFIADFFTSQEGVAYAGATAPRLGIFVVDTGGPPRAFVGPVARGYETFGPLAERYTDESARKLARREEPWAASYTVAAPAQPSSLKLDYDADHRQVVLTSDRALGPATIKALDHHRVPIATVRANVKKGATRVGLAGKGIGGIFIEIGAFRDFAVLDAYGGISGQWGAAPEQ